jgi:hypothetical protein
VAGDGGGARDRQPYYAGSDHEDLHLALTPVLCPGRSAARSGALQTRDLHDPWRSRISDAPLRYRSRCIASGTRGWFNVNDLHPPCPAHASTGSPT